MIERVAGGAGTDFGAPAVPPASDVRPLDEAELKRFQSLLKAYWQAFQAARQSAEGKELRKGPRGGGRDLEKMTRHVLEAERAYLSQLGWKYKLQEAGDLESEVRRISPEMMVALASAARGELPTHGPRGGRHWSPRFYVRYSGWHVLDHTWEIEDRILA